MRNELGDTDLASACELCGLKPDAISDATPAAWELLADLYLNIQVAADTVASSDSFDPDNPQSYDTMHLRQSFPPGTVTMIMRIATLMGLAVKDVRFIEPGAAQDQVLH